jgi:diacylglycerol O-acyltransferase / wax synthase
VADRLSSLDTSFLNLEDAATPMHVGSVMVFDAPTGGFDYESLVTLISQRIAHVPRYRQRIKTVPGGLANPVWVDDTHFDMSYHVRRSALPRPGSDEQLEELVARIQPRPLDRSRPMWEVYLVEGLAEDRFAIITKTHHSLVDGISAVDIGNVLVDGNPTASEGVLTTWRARPEPSGAELVVAALSEAARTPSQVVETIQHGVSDVTRAMGKVATVAGDVISTLARVSARPAPESPLNTSVGRARRYVMIGTDLEDYRKVRTRLGRGSFADEVTVNDVILATVAGAFRSWLLTRGESV